MLYTAINGYNCRVYPVLNKLKLFWPNYCAKILAAEQKDRASPPSGSSATTSQAPVVPAAEGASARFKRQSGEVKPGAR